MPELLDWRRAAKPRKAARVVASALHQGALVAFPTESSFLVAGSALSPAVVDRLQNLLGARPLEVIVPGPAAARDWLPGLGGAGRRLVRRLWPGPLTLVSAEGAVEGFAGRLPDRVKEAVLDDGALHLRHPAHEAILEVLRRLRVPLVGAGLAWGEGEAFRLREVVASAGSRLDLILDGDGRFDRPPTVVEAKGDTWAVRREGAVTADQVRGQLSCLIVFVCTGNTCRSPLAEGLCKLRLAEKLGCAVEELEDRGYLVRSAGLAASPGFPAANEAVEVAAAYGADLTAHESRPLTLEMVERADHLIVMTRGHAQALAGQLPAGSAQPHLLSADGDDVADPIGGSREVYEACARQLDEGVRSLIARVC